MSRFYKKIGLGDFMLEINKVFKKYEDDSEFNSIIEKDLSKIQFDRENISRYEENPDPKYYPGDSNFADYPVSIDTIGDDLHVYYVSAGGDWEYPICFILYWDGSKIRAYIPKDGNVYHKKQKVAYGSHEPDKDYPEDYDEDDLDKEFDLTKMENDILSRIILKP